MTKYVMQHLCSLLFTLMQISLKQVMSEASLQLFLRNGKTIRKTPIMESKSFFKENDQSNAVYNAISVTETFWLLQ